MTIRSVCVYCGANPGLRPEYMQAAHELGRTLAAKGLRLIYGGSATGLMGAVADGALENGGEAVGVIPSAFANRVGHTGLTERHVVDTMHQRKQMMFELSDAFIALPGGIGTMEEIFEMFTWAQLGFHKRPVGLLNISGYFDGLVAFTRHMAQERFLKDEHRSILLVEESPVSLLDCMTDWQPVCTSKLFTEAGAKLDLSKQ
ncbi:TIGR00730 family Rossman fold protein [Oleidesulfovibrio sp.]|uniref:LOG family protein n=1 Tax=Oleidesulfovibrio sp. TaxID=2909707 RepID=UPI003A863E9B